MMFNTLCHNLLLLFVVAQPVFSAGIAFQGSCADPSVLCEQLCIALTWDTYECWCWDGHVLLGDGLGCADNTYFDTLIISNFIIPIITDVAAVKTAVTNITSAGGRPSGDWRSIIRKLTNDSRIDVHFSNNHHTTALRPARFTGHTFLQFPAPESAYLETNITIEFRIAEYEEGILLFAGEHEGNDFISLTFNGRDIVFRFDCGEGTVEETYTGPFEKDVWHRLIVKRKFCERGEIRIDNNDLLIDEIRELENYKGITIETGICIGGASERVRNLHSRAITKNGFRGCIRQVVVNNITLYDTKSGINLAMTPIQYCSEDVAATTEVITELSSSSSFLRDPRHLKFFTLEAPFDSFDISLLDPSMFGSTEYNTVGLHKESKSKPKHVVNNRNLLHTSPRTNHDTKKATPISSTPTPPAISSTTFREYATGFDEASYVQVRAPSDANTYLELTFAVKMQLPNGIVYLLPSRHHYFSVYFENAFLIVQYALSDGYEIISSQHPLSLNMWHSVEIWRTGKAVLLKIDDQRWIERRSNRTVTVIDSGSYDSEYFGGAPNVKIPSNLPVRSGLAGCLKNIYQNGRFVDLLRDALATHKANQCGWDACARKQCQGHSQCIAYRAEPHCRCKFPTFGKTCEKNYPTTAIQQEMHFERFSYLKFSNHRIMKHVTGENFNLSFMILVRNVTDDSSPHLRDQVLTYTGNSESAGDYLHLLLSNEYELKLVVDLGSGPVVLTHPTTLIANGSWHNITVLRSGQHITLSVDELSINSVSPGPSIELNVYDSFYIGGLPKTKPSLLGFTGCISNIRIGSESIETPMNATEAVNISECY